GGDGDPPCVSERHVQRRLKDLVEWLPGIGGGAQGDRTHDRREQHRAEADPDRLAGSPEAVDLREDVPEYVRDRKEHIAGGERDGADEGQLQEDGLPGSDQVGAEKDRDGATHENVVVPVGAFGSHRLSIRRSGSRRRRRASRQTPCRAAPARSKGSSHSVSAPARGRRRTSELTAEARPPVGISRKSSGIGQWTTSSVLRPSSSSTREARSSK